MKRKSPIKHRNKKHKQKVVKLTTQKFYDWNRKLVSGQCPVCNKIFVYKTAVWNHFNKNHKKESDEYTRKLIEVNK